jgi:hypothetical protein
MLDSIDNKRQNRINRTKIFLDFAKIIESKNEYQLKSILYKIDTLSTMAKSKMREIQNDIDDIKWKQSRNKKNNI